ncbi:MAG: hypothetical protein ACLGH3_05625 [Actinomycetota bacterium]
MRNLRISIAASIAGLLIFASPLSAFAQDAQADAPGICAPWHRCLAIGGVGMVALAILALLVGYLIQRRGFDKVEHRQGNPEGVRVDEN